MPCLTVCRCGWVGPHQPTDRLAVPAALLPCSSKWLADTAYHVANGWPRSAVRLFHGVYRCLRTMGEPAIQSRVLPSPHLHRHRVFLVCLPPTFEPPPAKTADFQPHSFCHAPPSPHPRPTLHRCLRLVPKSRHVPPPPHARRLPRVTDMCVRRWRLRGFRVGVGSLGGWCVWWGPWVVRGAPRSRGGRLSGVPDARAVPVPGSWPV